MLSLRKKQLSDIAYDSGNGRPTRELQGDTLTTELTLDIEADVTIAAGAASGNLILEQPLTLVKRIQVFDGSDPVVDIDPRDLRQVTERISSKALSGVALANGGAQGPVTVRQQLRLAFADPLSAKPIETALIFQQPKSAYIQVEWIDTTDAGWKAGLVDANNDRTFTFANRHVRVLQHHDPVAFAKGVRPLFLPRIRTKTVAAITTQDDLSLKLETTNRVRWALLHSMLSNVTTENIINKLSYEDDRARYRDKIWARTWHELEQSLYGGATDDASLGMAYFFFNFAENGLLSGVWSPGQGSNPRFTLDVTGAANQSIKATFCELVQVSGVTAQLPANINF